MKPWYCHRPIAHRGLFDHAAKEIVPENSLSAFGQALLHDFPIELDVRLSSDLVPMVFHDNSLLRLTGVQGTFSTLSERQVKKLQLLRTRESVSSLKEVFELVQGRVPILLELKGDQPKKQLVSSADSLKNLVNDYWSKYPDTLALQSFHPFIVRDFSRYFNKVPLGLLLYDYKDAELSNWQKFLAKHNFLTPLLSRCQFIAVDKDYLRSPFIQILKKHYPLIVWTIRNIQERHMAEASGAQNIIFENLTTLKKI